MRDKDVKFEETEVSHTLGGAGEDRVQVRGKWLCCQILSGKKRSRRIRYMGEGSVANKTYERCACVRMSVHPCD